MAFFQLFQIWRPLSQRGLPGSVRLKMQSCQTLDGASTEGFLRFLAQIVSEKFHVFCALFRFCLCRFSPFYWKRPAQGETPGQIFHGTNHLACFPRFQLPGVSGSKVILLRKMTKIFQIFFSSSLGSKK